MIAGDNPASETLRDFRVQKISEDNTHLLTLNCANTSDSPSSPQIKSVPKSILKGREGLLG